MTLRRVYADANRVVIGYMIYSPAGRAISSVAAFPTFTDARGVALPMLSGEETATEAGSASSAFAFDAAALAGAAGPVHVHMTVPSIQAIEPLTVTAPAPGSHVTSTPMHVVGENAPSVREIQVPGPLMFGLTAR